MAQGQAESDIYVTRGPIASHCQPTSHHPTIPSTKRIFISHSSCPTCLTIQHMVSGFLVFWFLAILVIRKTTGLLAIRSWQPPAFQSIKVSPFPWHILFGTTRVTKSTANYLLVACCAIKVSQLAADT